MQVFEAQEIYCKNILVVPAYYTIYWVRNNYLPLQSVLYDLPGTDRRWACGASASLFKPPLL
jgi:hypothetical protein